MALLCGGGPGGGTPFKEQVGLLHVGPGTGPSGGSASISGGSSSATLMRNGSALLGRQPGCLREQEDQQQQRLLLQNQPKQVEVIGNVRLY